MFRHIFNLRLSTSVVISALSFDIVFYGHDRVDGQDKSKFYGDCGGKGEVYDSIVDGGDTVMYLCV